MFSFFGPEIPARPFNTQYACYSTSMLGGNVRSQLEWGGKIILPSSALDRLSRLNIVYPMLFKLTNPASGRFSHAGVLEFVADEGKVHLPYWMMENLMLGEGDLLRVESASLPVASYSKFQPHSSDFLELSNPKAVLESRLRNFACLSSGDVIAINYNDRIYQMSVLETKPQAAVSIIECDMNVEFAPPLGYVEPTAPSKPTEDDEEEPMDIAGLLPAPKGFVAFQGDGVRLDGKKKRTSQLNTNASTSNSTSNNNNEIEYTRGIPDEDFVFGTLKFIRNPKKGANGAVEGSSNDFQAFQGEGMSLKQAKDWK
uniref:Ubiquitin fusion degradation protein 1 homolog n=1 Tax=Caligus rogercresseyi TaxID=217165 RepID=C1BQE4_CALRO|nr:Ubiquitin fusion degradation protein 1 homolog [Caligus rogercresseyi]